MFIGRSFLDELIYCFDDSGDGVIDHANLLVKQDDLKDWQGRIPNPNPFNRGYSSPDEAARAKARKKRKKR